MCDFTWPNTPRLEATRLVIKLVVVLYITPFAQRIEKCLRVLWPCTPLLVLGVRPRAKICSLRIGHDSGPAMIEIAGAYF